MKWVYFSKIIDRKKQMLLKENRESMNKGDKNTYQNNCNQLKGIDFVMTKLKKFREENK